MQYPYLRLSSIFLMWQKKVLQRKNVGDREAPYSQPLFLHLGAICPINMSSLIQQSKTLDWLRFIAYNSFMRALLMHWDVTALGGSINWLVRASVGRCQTLKNWPSAMAALQQLLQLYTTVFCNILIKLHACNYLLGCCLCVNCWLYR